MLKRSFLFNLFLIALIIAALLFGFFYSLNYLTNHGQQTKVPAVEGKNMGEALKILSAQGFKVKVDSTYQSYKNPLEVLFQEPLVGTTVKVGRTIFLTVNRKTPPSIPMPNLINISFRNALLQMQSYRLIMGDTTYRPDVAAGAVLEQFYNGKPIVPGMLVPFGSKIDLVIGEGLSDMQDVPNLIGMTWNEARAYIESHNLTPNPIWEGSITDSNFAIIYSQQPEALNELDFKNAILSGDIMDLRIMQSPSPELLSKNMPGSRRLLGEDNIQMDSNGNPIIEAPINNPTIEMPVETPIRNRVPGVNVPSNATEKQIRDSKNNSGVNNKSGGLSVSSDDAKPKPKRIKPRKPKTESGTTNASTTNTEKPKADKPKPAVRKSDDNIKNEFE